MFREHLTDLDFNKPKDMIIADLFFYIIYNFLTKRFHRNEDDAKFSTTLLLSAFISFFIIDLILLLGIIHNNKISRIFLDWDIILSVFIAIVIAIIFYLRYYKYKSIKNIKKKLDSTNKINLTVMRIVIVLFVFIIPVFFYIFYRIYKFGRI
jgi:H+/Cl- antiporter ClcA